MMGRLAAASLMAALFLGCALPAAAASGTYVDVTIEAYRSWGFFGLGTWSELDANLIGVTIEDIAPGDAGRVSDLGRVCSSGGGDVDACALLESFSYRVSRSYAITPDLATTYRVVLRNRTESALGVVLEIDGLNTNGSTPVAGTSADKKWILRAGQTVRVSGWQVTEAEALAFEFAMPSQSHSPLTELRGVIRTYVYLPDPTAEDLPKGTGAAEVIDQPTVTLPFQSATDAPAEMLAISYARGDVGLGFRCEETAGAGVRVSAVIAGTVAELKGLRVGDVITYINAIPINTCGDLSGFLASKLPGDRVVLKVHREERAFLLTLEIQD
jgi:hypothetical protein